MPQIILLSDSIGVPPTPSQNQFYVYLDTDDQLKGINDNGEIFVLGGSGSSVGSGYIVGKEPTAPYTVIQDAIDAANAQFALDGFPKVVEIRPGTYTENLTFKEGVMLRGLDSGFSNYEQDSPTIKVVGSIQPPLSSSTHVSNIEFQPNGAASIGLFLANNSGSPLSFNVSFFKCFFRGLSGSAAPIIQMESDSSTGSNSLVRLFMDSCVVDATGVDTTVNQFAMTSRDSLGTNSSITSAEFLRCLLRNSSTLASSGYFFSQTCQDATCQTFVEIDGCNLRGSVDLSSTVGTLGTNKFQSLNSTVDVQELTVGGTNKFISGSSQPNVINSVVLQKTLLSTNDNNSELFLLYDYPSLGSPSKDTLILRDVEVVGNGWLPPYAGLEDLPETIYVRPNTFTIQQAINACYYAYSVDGLQREVVLNPGLYEESNLTLTPAVTLRGSVPFNPSSVFTSQIQTSANTLGWSSTSSGSGAQPLPKVAIVRNNDPELSPSFIVAGAIGGVPSTSRSVEVSDILFLTTSTAIVAPIPPYNVVSEDAGAFTPTRVAASFVNCGFGLMAVLAQSYTLFNIRVDLNSSVRFSNSAIGLVYASDSVHTNAANTTFLDYKRNVVGGSGALQFKNTLIQGNCGQNYSRVINVESDSTTSGTLTLSATNSEFYGACDFFDPGSGGLLEFKRCSFEYEHNNQPMIRVQISTSAHATPPAYIFSECSLGQPNLFGNTFLPVQIIKAVSFNPTKIVFSATDQPIAKLTSAPATIELAPGNQTILCDTSVGGTWTLLLPDPSNNLTSVNEQMEITVKDIGTASVTNITIKSGLLFIANVTTDGGSVTLKHSNSAPNYWFVV